MITLKSAHEIELMRRAGKITAAARAVARDMVTPGVTTQEIDKAVHKFITEQGAIPSFLHYSGYPASVCISVNDEIIHGIPGKRVLQEGDIVSVDVGAFIDGFHGDCAGTYPCGKVSDEALRLIRCHPAELLRGHQVSPVRAIACPTSPPPSRPMRRVSGYGIVREYVGHGIGRKMHEAPEVPNYGAPRPWPPAAAGHDHRRGAHGQRRLCRHRADARRLDRAHSRRQAMPPTMRTPFSSPPGSPELLTDPEGSLV